MKSIPIVMLFFLFTSTLVKAQTSESDDAWTQEELDNANTAKNTPYLSLEERETVFYLNIARTDGDRFFNTYFQDFVNQYNADMQKYSNYNEVKVNRKDKYYRGLQQDLKDIKGLPLFKPDEKLTFAAQQHAKDLSKNNIATHNSSDGRTVKDRLSKYFPRNAVAENLAFGFSTGLANVCMLLLDQNVPDLGHRKTILDTSYHLSKVGVNIRQHPGYKYCAVIDYTSNSLR